VQALIAARAGSHEEVVVAAARASVRAWLMAPSEPGWEPWITGRFVKSVRRARPAEFERICSRALAVEVEGGARVASFAPIPMEEWWEPLRKLHVGQFERERSGVWPPQEGGPRLLINPQIEMSTGKTAAQVAHALFAWTLRRDQGPRAEWAEAGLPFGVESGSSEFSSLIESWPIVIRDAGRTEIEPGTVTVIAF
jgi:peptidyl-tRNA hydrolase